MKVSTGELVAEYGGKLLACENVLASSLDRLAERKDASQYQVLAQESVGHIQRLRARYNIVLQAHGADVDEVLQGLKSADIAIPVVELSQEQVWVLDSIQDMYSRLSSRSNLNK